MATTLKFLKDIPHVAVAGEVKTFPDAVAMQYEGKGVAMVLVTPPKKPRIAHQGDTKGEKS